jgi:hypothetical protein
MRRRRQASCRSARVAASASTVVGSACVDRLNVAWLIVAQAPLMWLLRSGLKVHDFFGAGCRPDLHRPAVQDHQLSVWAGCRNPVTSALQSVSAIVPRVRPLVLGPVVLKFRIRRAHESLRHSFDLCQAHKTFTFGRPKVTTIEPRRKVVNRKAPYRRGAPVASRGGRNNGAVPLIRWCRARGIARSKSSSVIFVEFCEPISEGFFVWACKC